MSQTTGVGDTITFEKHRKRMEKEGFDDPSDRGRKAPDQTAFKQWCEEHGGSYQGDQEGERFGYLGSVEHTCDLDDTVTIEIKFSYMDEALEATIHNDGNPGGNYTAWDAEVQIDGDTIEAKMDQPHHTSYREYENSGGWRYDHE